MEEAHRLGVVSGTAGASEEEFGLHVQRQLASWEAIVALSDNAQLAQGVGAERDTLWLSLRRLNLRLRLVRLCVIGYGRHSLRLLDRLRQRLHEIRDDGVLAPLPRLSQDTCSILVNSFHIRPHVDERAHHFDMAGDGRQV